MWGGPGGLRNCKGEEIDPRPRTCNFAIWWDGDLLRELLDRTSIYKWDYQKSQLTTLFIADGCRWFYPDERPAGWSLDEQLRAAGLRR